MKISSFYTFCLVFLSGCSFFGAPKWQQSVPSSVFAFQNLESLTLTEAAGIPAVLTMDELGETSTEQLQQLFAPLQLPVKPYGVALIPVKRDEMKTVWWLDVPGDFEEKLVALFRKSGRHLSYDFLGTTMNKLQAEDSLIVYVAQMGKTLLVSESSFGVEEALRTAKEKMAPLLDADAYAAGGFYLNTPQLGRFFAELSGIEYGKRFDKIFDGLSPVMMETDVAGSGLLWKLKGSLKLGGLAPLAAGWFAKPVFDVTLDRAIPVDAAAWSIFFDEPKLSTSDKTDTLAYFLSRNPETKQLLLTGLGAETGWAAFSATGLNASGEQAFFRSIADSSRVQKAIQQLFEAALIYDSGDGSWIVGSPALARLIGGPWCPFTNFFLRVTSAGLVVSAKETLVQKIANDQVRGRVLYYDDTYLIRRPSWPEKVSGVMGGHSSRFFEYLSPSLNTRHRSDVLFRQAPEVLLVLIQEKDALSLSVSGFESGSTFEQTIKERWLFELAENDLLTAPPVLIDLKGSPRSEIFFATAQGRVVALAQDGTSVFEASTSPDVPLGSPLVFDWYNNKQKAVLIAAGSKIYGWSPDGRPLPKFPLNVGETITAPLTIADVNKDRTSDAIVTTSGAKLTVLNNRGIPLYGWPQQLNAPVYGTPVFTVTGNERLILLFSENVVHSWYPDGSISDPFPVMLNAALYGSPTLYENRIFGSGADGHLYVIGDALFPDSVDALAKAGGKTPGKQAIYISDTGLCTTPQLVNMKRPLEDGTIIESAGILLQNTGGAVFMIDMSGSIIFAQNMGQPSNEQQPPVLADLNGDGTPEILALAEFGRLFAWSFASQERLLDLPTASMQLMHAADLEGDGKIELIARTREGVKCWTIAL